MFPFVLESYDVGNYFLWSPKWFWCGKRGWLDVSLERRNHFSVCGIITRFGKDRMYLLSIVSSVEMGDGSGIWIFVCPPPQPSQKSFRIKKKLAKKQKQNRPIPHWIRMRTDNTIRWIFSFIQLSSTPLGTLCWNILNKVALLRWFCQQV